MKKVVRILEATEVSFVCEGNGQPKALLPTPREASEILKDESLQEMTEKKYRSWRKNKYKGPRLSQGGFSIQRMKNYE